MKRRLVSSAAALAVAWVTSIDASAQNAPPSAVAARRITDDVAVEIDIACRKAESYEKEPSGERSALRTCYGAAAGDRWNAVLKAAAVVEAKARAALVITGARSEIARCSPGAADGPPAAVVKARKDAADARAALDAVEEKVKAGTLTGTAATTAMGDARTKAKAAEDALTKAEADAKIEATKDLRAARDAMATAVDAALEAGTREDFEAVVESPERVKACMDFATRRRDAFASKAIQREAEDERASAHYEDILRKAPAIVSGALSGNGILDQAGSPDHIVLSAMTALGADQKTNGTQIVASLNVASLFAKSEDARLRLHPLARNMTLRTVLPLSATEQGQQQAAVETTTTTPPPEGTRFSVIVGSSFFDETDTRLPSHDRCYAAAAAYAAMAEDSAKEDERRARRKELYDVCNRIAAYQSRLSWRWGIGFIRPDGANGRTKTEVIAGALVWAPAPFIYFNGFVQGYLEPRRMNAYGGGFSLSANVGGEKSSGVDAWARIGIDLLAIYSYALATTYAPAADDVEYRITPTVRAKVLGQSFTTLGIGPRFLASDMKNPGLLATIALTYDADQLIDQQLTAPQAGR